MGEWEFSFCLHSKCVEVKLTDATMQNCFIKIHLMDQNLTVAFGAKGAGLNKSPTGVSTLQKGHRINHI